MASAVQVLDHRVRHTVPGDGGTGGSHLQNHLHGPLPLLCDHLQGKTPGKTKNLSLFELAGGRPQFVPTTHRGVGPVIRGCCILQK